MPTTEENYKEIIGSISQQDWQQLFDLIPEIENTLDFGDMKKIEKDENGIIQMPFWIPSPTVKKFQKIVNELPIIIVFGWSSWDEGREMANDQNFDFDSIDVLTKCKLITAIIRNNKFCDGALVSAFQSGLILKILKSMQKQITSFN